MMSRRISLHDAGIQHQRKERGEPMAKILVVDDSSFMRKVLSDILTKDGHEVVGQAENAEEAVTLYKELKPDLMTFDLVMPEVHGMTYIKAIKDIMAEDKGAKIIIISSLGLQQEIVNECIQAGARDFIIKPFKPPQVREAVRQALNGSH